MSDEPEYRMSDKQMFGLVMPFVACQSHGGSYDDEAYVAGYEMGLLDRTLRESSNPLIGWTQVIHAGNEHQADLLAMRHGFTMETESTDYDEWLYVTFSPAKATV